jgi:hypothetical protein
MDATKKHVVEHNLEMLVESRKEQNFALCWFLKV